MGGTWTGGGEASTAMRIDMFNGEGGLQKHINKCGYDVPRKQWSQWKAEAKEQRRRDKEARRLQRAQQKARAEEKRKAQEARDKKKVEERRREKKELRKQEEADRRGLVKAQKRRFKEERDALNKAADRREDMERNNLSRDHERAASTESRALLRMHEKRAKVEDRQFEREIAAAAEAAEVDVPLVRAAAAKVTARNEEKVHVSQASQRAAYGLDDSEEDEEEDAEDADSDQEDQEESEEEESEEEASEEESSDEESEVESSDESDGGDGPKREYGKGQHMKHSEYWKALKLMGWGHANGNFPEAFMFLMPGVKKSTGTVGVDMFNGETGMEAHIHECGYVDENLYNIQCSEIFTLRNGKVTH